MSTPHDTPARTPTRHHPAARRPGPPLTITAATGLVGTAGCTAVAVALGLARPGYDFVTQPVVALMSGPGAWAQDVNFVVLGVAVVAVAAALHLGVGPSRWGAAGPALLALSGAGPVLAGLTSPVPAHFALTFVSAALGFALLSRRLARDADWSGHARAVLGVAVAIAVVVPVHSALAIPDDGPLHAVWGLLNWTAVGLWTVTLAVLARWQLRLSRG